ncbi:SMI1/KNR4 family protein [Chitinophaga sp. Mgbs1]|uniref:SMI1/KNR4 family protein n=1 Tax=Chitinophaga solisilvae TaxID=1233460 RepID=A0A3S1B270_9BACT|nr:SMI1/KNR4 family protein [Chitinophaga solisilvae]
MYNDIVTITQEPKIFGDQDFLDTFRFENGYPFPPSYTAFCNELGYGKLCDLFLIYIPMGDHPDSWVVQYKKMKGLFDYYLDPPLFAIREAEGGTDLIANAIPFARSENGEFLFWDIRHPQPHGEFPVYFTDFSTGIRPAGNSLTTFIKNVSGEATFKSVLKFYQKPLEASFQGFKELIW